MSSEKRRRGILLNVDYDDELARYRLREVFMESRRRMVPSMDKIPQYALIDSFYLHYRSPMLGQLSDLKDEKDILWYHLVNTYIRSDQYGEAVRVTKLNGHLSKLMAVKMLRIYSNLLSKMERSEGFRQMVNDSTNRSSSSKENKAIIEREIRSLLSFYLGNMRRINETVKKVKSVMGSSIGHEVADILLSTDIDPYRTRLINMLDSLVKLISDVKYKMDLLKEEDVVYKGISSGIKKLSHMAELRDVTPSDRALMRVSKPLYAYKLGTNNILVNERKLTKKPKVYLLIDKSGSMFYTVMNNLFEFGSISKITWATALATVLVMKGSNVQVRFFDQQVYPAISDKKEIIKTLLSLIPLGGTNITAAVNMAMEDARRNPQLRDYKLVLITDGEDDELSMEPINNVRSMFSNFKVVLIGNEQSMLESNKNTIKISSLTSKSLMKILKSI